MDNQTFNMLASVPLLPHVSQHHMTFYRCYPMDAAQINPVRTEDSCSAAKLSCCMFCGYYGMSEYQNDKTKFISSDDADDICEPND